MKIQQKKWLKKEKEKELLTYNIGKSRGYNASGKGGSWFHSPFSSTAL